MKTAAAVLFGAAVVAAGAPAAAQSEPGPSSGQRDCFFSSQWRGWSSPEPGVILLRVGLNDIYRVELVGERRGNLKNSGRFLITEMRGGNSICSPLDLDMAISDTHGFRTPLIARTLTKLTPEQVAAIPRQDLP